MMVSARKVKARLDKNKLAELKTKNTEKQTELALSVEEARTFSDELVKSAIAGFETELQKSSPAMKQLAVNLSGMLQEFFIGFKQGVDAELNTFIKDTSKTLSKTANSMNVAVAETMQKTSDVLKEPIQDLAEEVKETRKEREKVTKEQKTEMVISDVLKRPTEAEGAAKTVLGKKGNVKDWLTRVGLGSIGMEETAEKIVTQRQQKEAYVQTETKLRSKEFEGMDPKEVRKTLEEQFKVISETTEKLRGVEKEIGAYKELGYSEEQAQQLAGGEKQQLAERLVAADPSRMEKYKELATEPTVKEKVEKKESSSVLEETLTEQAKLDEEAVKQRENQTTLLGEIRDILKTQKPTAAAGAAPAESGGMQLPIPDIGLPKPGRGGLLKSAGRAALGVAKKAAPWAIAGSIMLGGINAVDTGLGKLGVGKDKEGNDLAIDETQDEANWQKMSTGGKIMSGAARGIEKVGSFLGLDSLTRGARADRIKSETEYLKGKETTVQDVKKATSELQQNRVETQTKKEPSADLKQKAEFARQNALADGASPEEADSIAAKMLKYGNVVSAGQGRGDVISPSPSNLEQKRANIASMAKPGESAAVTKGREKALVAIDKEIEREKPSPAKVPASTNAKEYMIDSRQIPVPVEKKGFFSGLVDKAKSLFGIGNAPTVEAKPAKEAGPNWKATLSSYAENSTPVTSMEQQYPGISKKYIELAKKSVPITDNMQSIETHEQMLKTKAIGEMSKGKGETTAVPTTTAPANLEKTSEKSWAPTPSTVAPAPLTAPGKANQLQQEAAKLGIKGKVTGTFEGGVLTKINETETGKVHDIAIKDEDRRNVEAARNLKAANLKSASLQEAAIARENGVPKPLPTAVKEATPEQSAKQTAAEIGKNITVQSPAPVVMPAPAAPAQTTSAPFTTNIRNDEPSISDYLRSRYAY